MAPRRVEVIPLDESSTLSEEVSEPKKRKKFKLPKTLEREEAEALLKAPNTSAITGLRNRCMLEMMYQSGLRVGEVCSLKVEHVNLKRNRIRVWDGKGGDRTLAVNDGLTAILQQWVVRKKKETDGSVYFFCTIKGGPVSTNYVEKMIKRAAKRAGIEKNVTPHMLRHTCATELLEDGVDLKVVQDILGHKALSTTEIYLHVNPIRVEQALRQRRSGR